MKKFITMAIVTGVLLLAMATINKAMASDNASENVAQCTHNASETQASETQATGENMEIEIFYMYHNEVGLYFLDPKAEYENVIFVDYESWENWGFDYQKLHHGNKFIGIFDPTGWELYEVKSIK